MTRPPSCAIALATLPRSWSETRWAGWSRSTSPCVTRDGSAGSFCRPARLASSRVASVRALAAAHRRGRDLQRRPRVDDVRSPALPRETEPEPGARSLGPAPADPAQRSPTRASTPSCKRSRCRPSHGPPSGSRPRAGRGDCRRWRSGALAAQLTRSVGVPSPRAIDDPGGYRSRDPLRTTDGDPNAVTRLRHGSRPTEARSDL